MRRGGGWQPSQGAWLDGGVARFRVWAPERRVVELLTDGAVHPLRRGSDGTHTVALPLPAGALYRYRLDGDGPFPDPAARFLPQGVHGPAELVDPTFGWTDAGFRPPALSELVLYELHVGTFTPEGTFAAAAARLPYLRDLGITAIELMPLADFPGRWNWGYDGVAPFAPARCYGRPENVRAFVDAAHTLGLAVHLDVVYNHFGPDGAYQGQFSPHWFTDRHRTPWGQAIDFDGPHSAMVRGYFVENALHWVEEYHIDGLRIDATHAMNDDGPRHFVAELAATVKAHASRDVVVIAEDHRNLAHLLRPESQGGWGCDGVWAGDFHHQIRRALAGDGDGYYRDYAGSLEDLATTIGQGWFFTGGWSAHRGKPRGTDPTGLPPRAFVVFLQNHDQIGNRAAGERLHHQIDPAVYRAASVLLLCLPQTPLLFMGQEWAASSPFLFFTDHEPELGRAVTEGRRKEFRTFAAFADAAARERIPDPQHESTFTRSRLDWSEPERAPHATVLSLYRAVLALRRAETAPGEDHRDTSWATAVGDEAIVLRRGTLECVAWLAGGGEAVLASGPYEVVLSTEDARFCLDPRPVLAAPDRLRFLRPGAVLLRRSPA